MARDNIHTLQWRDSRGKTVQNGIGFAKLGVTLPRPGD
jgi:hypothetical protein